MSKKQKQIDKNEQAKIARLEARLNLKKRNLDVVLSELPNYMSYDALKRSLLSALAIVQTTFEAEEAYLRAVNPEYISSLEFIDQARVCLTEGMPAHTIAILNEVVLKLRREV